MAGRWQTRIQQKLTTVLLACLLILMFASFSSPMRHASGSISSHNPIGYQQPSGDDGTAVGTQGVKLVKSDRAGACPECHQSSLLERSREQQQHFCEQLAAYQELYPPSPAASLAVETPVHWSSPGLEAAWRMFVLQQGDIVSQSILRAGSWERQQVLGMLEKMREISRGQLQPGSHTETLSADDPAVLIDIGGNVGTQRVIRSHRTLNNMPFLRASGPWHHHHRDCTICRV